RRPVLVAAFEVGAPEDGGTAFVAAGEPLGRWVPSTRVGVWPAAAVWPTPVLKPTSSTVPAAVPTSATIARRTLPPEERSSDLERVQVDLPPRHLEPAQQLQRRVDEAVGAADVHVA